MLFFADIILNDPVGVDSAGGDVCGGSCGPDEPWVYGETAYEAIRHVVAIRESLRNYIQEQYRKQSQTGNCSLRNPVNLTCLSSKRCRRQNVH